MDVDLILSITGLSNVGEGPAPYLHPNKDTTKMKKKYELQRAGRGFLIAPIEDNTVRFTAKILSCKLLRKMYPTECTADIVELEEQCTERVVFNW